ncbi:MAG TPA: CcmD family protein [Longimicrobium sp.]|jgi:CcmD family protein
MRILAFLIVALCLSAVVAAQAPEHAAPPRTLRAYWHVFAAFTFAWLMILGYAVSLARRFRRLEEKLDSHRGTEAQR